MTNNYIKVRTPDGTHFFFFDDTSAVSSAEAALAAHSLWITAKKSIMVVWRKTHHLHERMLAVGEVLLAATTGHGS